MEMILILCARGAFLTRRCKLDALFFSLQIIFMIMTNRTPTTSLFDFSDEPIECHLKNHVKAEFAEKGTFFTNIFPSLRIFANKKSWKLEKTKTSYIISVLKVVY